MRKPSWTAMTSRAAVAFLLAALVFPAIASNERGGKIAIGDEAPAGLGVNREGDDINAKTYAGKVLVVTFWASWCGPCRKELPILENLQRAARDSVQVVAINIEDRDQYRAVSRAMAPFKLMVAHDYRKLASEAYGVNGIPHMVIIGRDGKVRNVHRGYDESMIDGLVAEINAALAAK